MSERLFTLRKYRHSAAGNVNHVMIIISAALFSCCNDITTGNYNEFRSYYVDSKAGDDSDSGLSEDTPWQSIAKVNEAELFPGDVILFKRGAEFFGTLDIKYSGTETSPIKVTDYGDPMLPAPSFTNPVFDKKKNLFGNCIRLQGAYITVENLYFHKTPAEIHDQSVGFETMWELGAIYVDKKASHCIISGNEINDCGVGIKSYGPHAIIENNYIHDCNRVLKEWGWGPIAIWLGGDHQEVRHNRIFNYSAVDPRITWGPNSYGGGADGGAIEIDDARVDKSDISIHHNYSRDCQGFLEVTWTDVKQNPNYRNFSIHHNISDDYQQFVAIWRGADFKIENNTIIRRKVNANDWGVFNITQDNAKNLIRNNIVVVEKNIQVFNLGKNGTATPNNVIKNNLFFAMADTLNIGLEGPGVSAVFGDPHFQNYNQGSEPGDFSVTVGSAAIDKGLSLQYEHDFRNTKIPQGDASDIGAFEYIKN